jgi:hypothetical protein
MPIDRRARERPAHLMERAGPCGTFEGRHRRLRGQRLAPDRITIDQLLLGRAHRTARPREA